MAHAFTLPGRTVIGKNALAESERAIRALGKKALIVSGRIVTKTGTVKILTDFLERWDIAYAVFNDIVGEPTDRMIDAGVRAYREAACDFIIAVGGGSPLDSAKAIAAMTVLDGKLSDYMGKELTGAFPPTVLIPTTAGTGSETTKFTVITDTERNIKMLLRGETLLPDVAVVDPAFTLTAPPSITAATGMDALTHAVESYTSRLATPLTDPYALDAIRRIFRALPAAFRNGADEEAREQMSIAAFEAGVCISNASVTLVHGMSRPIGALFHVPHGISNAMLIAECLEFAKDGCTGRFADIGRAIGAAGGNDSDAAAADAFFAALRGLCGTLQIPTLRAYGIPQEKFQASMDKMAEDALASGSPANTIKLVTKDDILAIYTRLWA